MEIRRADEKDLAGVHNLLGQVLEVHAAGRPDIFRSGTRKYTDEELLALFQDDTHPVFVAVDDHGTVLGHAFCEVQDYRESNSWQPIVSLYIDDICVDEKCRGTGVGKALYSYVREWAKEQGYTRITLDVWSCNPSAMQFYIAMGLVPYKICMETLL